MERNSPDNIVELRNPIPLVMNENPTYDSDLWTVSDMIGTAAPSEALHAPYTMNDAKHAKLDIMLYESVDLMMHPAAVGLMFLTTDSPASPFKLLMK